MSEVIRTAGYLVLGIASYLFVIYAMKIERWRATRFIGVLCLFMAVFFFSPAYRELMTPYILIFWPFEFGVMLYVCDALSSGGVKRILSCAIPMAAALVMGILMQDEPVTVKTLMLTMAPWAMGAVMGLIGRMLNGRFGGTI